jgi:hypothetical protein
LTIAVKIAFGIGIEQFDADSVLGITIMMAMSVPIPNTLPN